MTIKPSFRGAGLFHALQKQTASGRRVFSAHKGRFTQGTSTSYGVLECPASFVLWQISLTKGKLMAWKLAFFVTVYGRHLQVKHASALLIEVCFVVSRGWVV